MREPGSGVRTIDEIHRPANRIVQGGVRPRAELTEKVSVAPAPPTAAALPLAPPPSRATLEPVSDDTYSLRVTFDAALEKEIGELKALLSHKIPNGDLTAVLREAVQCALEKHRKRKGAAEPSRKRKSPVAAKPVKKIASGRSPSPQRSGARCGSGMRVGAPGAPRTASAAAAPGRSNWTTSSRRRSVDPARSRISGSSAGRITPFPRSNSSGGRTWSCSEARRPERVKLLPPAKVAARRNRQGERLPASLSTLGHEHLPL